MRRVAAVVVAAALVLAACEAFPIGPTPGPQGVVRGNWVWPSPAPLPPGAVAVPLVTQEIQDIPPDAEVVGCPLALLGSVTPEYRPNEDPPVRYRQGDGFAKVGWPVGFSARLNPRLEIVAPDGKVFAREGAPTDELGGGLTGGDDTFFVCVGGYGPERLDG